MNYTYYHRSKLHLLSIIQRVKQHLPYAPQQHHDATFEHLAKKLNELDTAVQCLNHRLTQWEPIAYETKKAAASKPIREEATA